MSITEVNDTKPQKSRDYGIFIAQVVHVLLGAILLIAAAMKGYQLATEPAVGNGLLSNHWLLIGLVEFELFLGLWLLSGLWPRHCRWVAIGCFTIFTGVALYKIASGADSCGCFGRASVNPWYTLLLDSAAIGALLFSRPTAAPSSTRPMRLKVAAFAFVAIGLGVAGGSLLVTSNPQPAVALAGEIIGESSFVLLEPKEWIGKRFPLFNYIDMDGRLDTGRWIVMLYHHDCPDCQKAVPQYEQLAHQWNGRSDAPRIALIEIPPYAAGQGLVSPNSPCIAGRLRDVKEWFVAAPVAVFLEAGKVMKVFDRDHITPTGILE